MASTPRRVVLTGIGVISPIGIDAASYWQSLVEGKSGVRSIRHADVSEFDCRIAATVEDFDAKKFMEKDQRKSLRVMARTIQMGVATANLTLQDAGIKKGSIDPTRFGIDYGSAMVHTELDDIGRASKVSVEPSGAISLKTWGETGMKEIPPTWMLKYLPNMPACHITVNNDMQGPSNTITSGEVSSLLTFGEAWRLMDKNLADVMMVGGCECKLNPLNFVRQSLFQPLTKHNDDPAKALRPFDQTRDGTVLSEGAVNYTLEGVEHAKKRGAKIYAELAGFASGFDRPKDGRVMAKVLNRALEQAGASPDQVDHVNGHGLGTIDADLWEAKALNQVFGEKVPVVGYKGFFGAAGPAGSAMEMLASVLAFQHGQLPAMINCNDQDPECRILLHRNGLKPITKPYAVKLSTSDMGHVAVAVLKRWDE
jgi:3-oxoacyl-[acyl-carrier-protein] synthase II